MKGSTKEDLANHFGHELYADGVNVMGVATTEGYAGKLLSSVPHPYRVPTLFVLREGKIARTGRSQRFPQVHLIMRLCNGRKTLMAVQPICTILGSQMIS